MSRKKSELHEAQLNIKLLEPFVEIGNLPETDCLQKYYGIIDHHGKGDLKMSSLIDTTRFNLILHPKSKGSAREWPLTAYETLIEQLPEDKFRIFVTGTREEGVLMQDFLTKNQKSIVDLTGKFTLKEFIGFISQSDGLVAASTGPLHLAAAMGKLAIGIYPPIRPMHPGRWSPIGKKTFYLVADKKCKKCRKAGVCTCMAEIKPEEVTAMILNHAKTGR